jgi:GNAT superfamily N-acetyltransferase
VIVAPLEPADAGRCEAILRALPRWFALEASIRAYVRVLATAPGFVARRDGAVVGFAGIRPLLPGSAEIEVMAVLPEHHRSGTGSALVSAIERWCDETGVRWLVVKTRGASASDPDPEYAATRAFYRAVGFEPLFETTAFWGPQDPALVSVRRLGGGCGDSGAAT